MALRLVLMMAALVALAAPAEAATLRMGMRVVIPADETIPDDLYVLGAQIEVRGRVRGDVLAAGGPLTIAGPVEGNLNAACTWLGLQGPVGGALRLAAAESRLANAIGRDVVAAVGALVTTPSAHVGGETLLAAGEATLDGHLGRMLRSRASNMTLAGSVDGPVKLEAPRLVIAPSARIAGPLSFQTATPNALAPGATVSGPIDASILQPATFRDEAVSWLVRFAMALAAGLMLLWLWPSAAELTAKSALSSPWLRVLLGLGVLIGAPFVAIMTMLTVIGLPLGLIGLGLYIACVYLATVAAGWSAGYAAVRRFSLLEAFGPRAAALAGGLAVLMLAMSLPVVGQYVTLVVILWGLGALTTAMYRGHRART